MIKVRMNNMRKITENVSIAGRLDIPKINVGNYMEYLLEDVEEELEQQDRWHILLIPPNLMQQVKV